MTQDIRWKIVLRRGMNVEFACGHRHARKAAFLCQTPASRAIFVRRVPRPQADARPCHDCLLASLAERDPRTVRGFEGLVPLEEALRAAAGPQKNRPI